MTQVLINVPEEEMSFFNLLMTKFNYSSKVITSDSCFSFSESLIEILDERLGEDTATYIHANIALQKLKEKHGV